LGEDYNANPSTPTNAAQYTTKLHYHAPITVVADPKWQVTTQGINHGNSGSIALPYLIILDGDMTIKKVDADINDVISFLAEKTGKQFTAADAGSCDGYCGAQGPGCYCTADCLQYGDCCADACELCGHCK